LDSLPDFLPDVREAKEALKKDAGLLPTLA